MSIQERPAAVELELAHQRELRKLRAIADDLAVSRVERVEGQQAETRKVLPKLQDAMKELEEAVIVTSHLQSRHVALLKDHAEWLQESRENGRKTDERIANLVSAIGEFLRRNGK